MNKVFAVKSVMCAGAIAAALAVTEAPNVLADPICPDTGLAGITLSLDQYTDIADSTETVKKTEKKETKKEEKKEEKSEYENVGISIANDYVNIRKKPDTESKIKGKLYKGSAATILKRKGEWVKIQSGSVIGYINADYLAIGADAEKLVDKYATKWAVVNTTTLKVREKKSTKATTLTLIPEGERYEVLKDKGEWYKILVDEAEGEESESTKGYVSADYVDIDVEFEEAISIKEEKEKLRKEEEARKAEQERLRQLELEKQQQQAANNSSSSSSSNSSSNSSSSNSSSSSSSSSSNRSSSNSSSSSSNNTASKPSTSNQASDKPVQSGSGSAIAAYAQKFVGNPYVYGGTSLTNGTDCSGFTQSVYAHFGIRIPRTSREQAGAGRKVDLGSLQPGDLITYASNGRVNHVAMYIGGGRVVHASNRKTGIKISTWNYRTPYNARRIVG